MADLWQTADLDEYLTRIVNEDDVEEQLVQESRWKISYRESQFQRRGLVDAHARVTSLDDADLSWDGLGVADGAVTALRERGVPETRLHRYFAHPAVLEDAELLGYYRTLAGVSENRLRKMKTLRPAVRAIEAGRSDRPEDATRRLCRFFNSLLSTWASGLTDGDPKRRALHSALLTEGAAIEGSSRNAGGRKAVVNVASVLVEEFVEYGLLESFEVKRTSGDDLRTVGADELGDGFALTDLAGAYDVGVVRTTNGGSVNLDGTEPDMVVRSPAGVTAYGEIKDRKDVSNQWEGWLPLVRSKLEGFRDADAGAERLLLQRVYTRRMIDGERGSDAEDVGIREWVTDGLLDVPFNVSQILADEASRDFFGAYVRRLLGYEVGAVAPA